MRFSSSRALLTLLAVLAVSAVGVSAAAAATLPEFKPVPTKKKFTGTGGKTTMLYGGGSWPRITCTASSTAGEIAGAKTVGAVTLTFTGCKVEVTGGGDYCVTSSIGAKNAGEMVIASLVGELGTVATTEAASGVGMLLKPEKGEK